MTHASASSIPRHGLYSLVCLEHYYTTDANEYRLFPSGTNRPHRGSVESVKADSDS